jgi:hypothetical protein
MESLLVGVYVDDLIVTRSSTRGIDHFNEQMKKMFSMSDLGLLNYYLGIEVSQTPEGITLCQAGYATKLLERSGMKGCSTVQIPMEARLHLSKTGKGSSVDATQYRSIVGSLWYLIHTRPDITFAVGIVSRFMENPKSEHLAAMKHILRYVSGTVNLGLSYHRKKGGNLRLIGYSDSDLAGDVDDRKSTSGVLFYLGSSPVSWFTQKQKSVAISTCEAEYMAETSASCKGIWLGRLLSELLDVEFEPVTLNMDNQSAIALCKNPVFHERSKHIDTKYHFIREKVEEGLIDVKYCGTNDQLADILTKPLARLKFHDMRERVGMILVKKVQPA